MKTDKLSSLTMKTLFVLLIVLPIALIFIISLSTRMQFPDIIPKGLGLKWWKYLILENDKTLKIVGNTLLIAFVTVLINLAIGLPAASALGRYEFKGKIMIQGIIMLPIIVPAMAVTMGVYKNFIRLGLTETILGVAISHVLPSIPYMIEALRVSYSEMDESFIEQSRMLGASDFDVFRKVTIFFIMPGIISGTVLTVLISMSQYGITQLIGGGYVETLAIAMYPFISSMRLGIGAVFSVIFGLIAILVMVFLDIFLKWYYRNVRYK